MNLCSIDDAEVNCAQTGISSADPDTVLSLEFYMTVRVFEAFPSDGVELRQAVKKVMRNGADARSVLEKYGPLERWDVSKVVSMAGLFTDTSCGSTFNGDIANWDVSNVTDMR